VAAVLAAAEASQQVVSKAHAFEQWLLTLLCDLLTLLSKVRAPVAALTLKLHKQ
jgi:hypothetical protein